MMSSPKTISVRTDTSFDDPARVDYSLVGLMTRQVNSSVQQNDHFQDLKSLPLGNPIVPKHGALSILNNLDLGLFSTGEPLTEPSSAWKFISSLSMDLEPTPIKPDLNLRQEKELQESGGENSVSSDTPPISTIVPSSDKRTNKKASITKRKRKSKHPVFRSYQKHQFQEQYEALLRFKQEHGHCLVPHTYEIDPALSRWVKRQRYQYKLKMAGNNESTMTEERVAMLQEVGFVWDSHKLAWQDRLRELREYKEAYGDCNVPSTYTQNPALGTWVKCQRRLYRRLYKGEACNITLERIAMLDGLGFDWRRRY